MAFFWPVMTVACLMASTVNLYLEDIGLATYFVAAAAFCKISRVAETMK